MTDRILAWLLFEESGAVLFGRRKAGSPPLAGQWTLPGGAMREDETAEECLARFGRGELDVRVTGEQFATTLEITEGGESYAVNVFRVTAYAGKLRFRESGPYEELRWVRREDIAAATVRPLPRQLREWLSAGLRNNEAIDNRAAWNTISAAYQAKHRLKTDTAHYGPRMPTEADLQLVGDIMGKRLLEIGCGGGQCAIAFAKQGAIATGIDQSRDQIAFARRLAEKEGVRADFLEGDIATLPQVESGSQDVVFSAYALNYVEEIATCLAEVSRVLRPGGVLVFSTNHPARGMMAEEDQLRVVRSYWDEYAEWEWGEEGSGVWMRDWTRTIESWFTLMRNAGFVIDRILEPRMLESAHDETWDDSYPLEQGRLVPGTLILRAVKP